MARATSAPPTSLLSPALTYCRFQISVVPLVPRTKKSLVKWKPYQTERASAGQIEDWWRKTPDANIGLITGEVSGLFIMDVDDEEAVPSLAEAGFSLDTARVRTRQGLHFYYKHPGFRIPTKAGVLPGIDVRGDGGLVAAPPSIHESGHVYETIDGDYPMRGVLADAGNAAHALFNVDDRPEEKLVQDASDGDHLELSDRTQKFLRMGASEPGRNDELYRAGCDMSGARYRQDEATDTLLGAALMCSPPIPEAEALATIASSYSEKRDPTMKAKNNLGRKAPVPVADIQQDITPPEYMDPEPEHAPVLDWEQARADIVGDGFCRENPFRAQTVAEAMTRCFHWMTRPGEGDSGGILYFYEDGVYRPNGTGVAERLLIDFLGDYATRARWNDVIECVKVLTRVRDWDGTVNNGRMIPADARHTWLNLLNGLYNWRSDTLIAHNPRYLSTIQLTVKLERNAPDGFIARFWKMCIPEGCDLLAKQILGYLLFPTTDKERAFLAVGPAGTGKSRFLEMVRALLGAENVGFTDLLTLSDNKYGAHDLVDKLANLGDDLQSGTIQDSSTFKKVVSGIPMRAEQKYQAAFSFRPVARLMFTANEIPRSRDKQDAWYVRWVILPFTRVVRGTSDEIDAAEFMDRVDKQLPGLLNYALEGLRSLEDMGKFVETPETTDAKEDMMRENDPVYAFMADHLSFSTMPAATIATSADSVREKYTAGKDDLFQRFASWCDAEGIKFPVTRRDFNKRIKASGKVVESKGSEQDAPGLRNKRVWRGVQMLDIRSGEEHLDEERY